MAISQEKVCGWLVYYGSGEIGQYPGGVVELEVIPEVWELYVLEHPDKFDTSNYYGFFAWKRELSLKEKRILKRNADSLTRQIKEVWKDFTQFQEDYLDLWNDFCAEYQNLPPERIQAAREFCVLDSVTTPAAPSDPVEYVLDFAVQNNSGNVWPGVVILGPISSPSGFMEALETNISLREIIKRSLGKNASGGFEHVEIQERGKYFEQHPERRFNTQIIPELADFVKAYNAGGSQAAPASGSFLVSPDSAPADPGAIPAGFVPAVIQGEFAEIQGSVRDSKRETSLTELKKHTSLLEQIAENTSSGNAKPKTRLETLRETYLTYCQTVNQNTARYLMRENHKCSYEEIWKIEHWGEDWDSVDPEIRRQEIANIRAGVSQARPKQS
ncbi:MAG: hypothetical protein IJQ31_14845 [Thermoguttaceae bacterium]|nr:hypothetical protein [Thermoguttaceae bacterium]